MEKDPAKPYRKLILLQTDPKESQYYYNLIQKLQSKENQHATSTLVI